MKIQPAHFINENNCNFKEANFMAAHNLEDKDWERTTSDGVTLKWETPVVGDFYIFPSYLLHKVNQQMVDKERITVAFNYGI